RTVTALGCSRVFYVEGPEPALHELDLALGPQPGTPVQTTRYELPVPPRRLARETYDSWVEWQLERAPEGARAATREFYASIFSEWPLPPVVSLFVDDMERVWVEAYSAEGQHNWLVLELPSAYGV